MCMLVAAAGDNAVGQVGEGRYHENSDCPPVVGLDRGAVFHAHPVVDREDREDRNEKGPEEGQIGGRGHGRIDHRGRSDEWRVAIGCRRIPRSLLLAVH